MSRWHNKSEILKDLAEVTFGEIHVNINNAITGDKPSICTTREDIEDEYLKEVCGVTSSAAEPDLPSIQQMLSIVDEVDCNENVPKHTECNQGDEGNLKSCDNREVKVINNNVGQKPRNKHKSRRNVTVTYIRNNFCKESEDKPCLKADNNKQNNTTLLTPDQFLQTNDVNKIAPDINPNAMFVRKIKKAEPEKITTSKVQNNCSTARQFTPSTYAQDLYEKYKKNSENKMQAAEDIWSRAERSMREIEAKSNLQKSCEGRSS